MSGSRCKKCAFVSSEVVDGTGEPLLFPAWCRRKGKNVDDDDWCNDYKLGKWAEEKVAE